MLGAIRIPASDTRTLCRAATTHVLSYDCREAITSFPMEVTWEPCRLHLCQVADRPHPAVPLLGHSVTQGFAACQIPLNPAPSANPTLIELLPTQLATNESTPEISTLPFPWNVNLRRERS